LDKKQKSILLLSIFTISLLFLLNLNNSVALQDNDDLEAILHCRMDTNSAEILSTSMPLGIYSFFDEPELDVGSFSHDLTKIDVSRIQAPVYNSTSSELWDFVDSVNGTQGNHSFTLDNSVPHYKISGGLDTRIDFNMTYLGINYTYSELYFDDFDATTNWTLYDEYDVEQSMQEGGIYYKGTHTFENEEIGTTPDGFTDNSNLGNTNYIIDSIGNHKKIINQHIDAGNGGYARIDKDLVTPITNDLEFYYYPSVDIYSFLQIDSGANLLFQIKFEAQATKSLKILDGSGWRGLLEYTEKWYHFKVKFNFGSNQYDLYVDNALAINNGNFYQSGSNWDELVFNLNANYGDPSKVGNAYINAIGIIGLNGYEEGDNLEQIEYALIDQEGNSGINLERTKIFPDLSLELDDIINVTMKTTTNNEFGIKLLKNDVVLLDETILNAGNTEHGIQTLNITIPNSLKIDQIIFHGILGSSEYLRFYNISINGFSNENIFETCYFENFTYQVLGVNYTDTYKLTLDTSISDFYQDNGTYYYYLDSTQFNNYDYFSVLTIPNQKVNLILNFDTDLNYNMTTNISISYSSNSWKLPSETNLQINGEDVIDTSLNSGVVFLSEYPEPLEITADIEINYELNITIDFTFSFDLDVISKTYLKKLFKLLSDHSIYIEMIDLPSVLQIYKIYLNSIDLGSDNPNDVSPDKEMNANNIFSLEVILSEELYIPLNYVGDLEDDIFGNIYSEVFLYESSDMNHIYYPDEYNNTYSFLNQKLEMENHFPSEFHNEDWNDWASANDSDYTQTSDNNGKFSSRLNTYNNSIMPEQPSDFTFTNGTFNNTYGDLNNIDGNYTILNSTNIQPSGTYLGWDSFTDDTIGNDPSKWTVSESGDGIVNVIASLDGHDKIVHQSRGTGGAGITRDFSEDRTVGAVEYWIRAGQTDKRIYLRFYDVDNGGLIYFYMHSTGKFVYYDGAAHDIMSYSADQWYHLRIEWDCSDDWHLWIDGVSKDGGSGYGFDDNPTDIDRMVISTSQDNMELWCDAVDKSWNDGYYLNRNNDTAPVSNPTVNLTVETQLDTSMIHSNDTIDFIDLKYSYNSSVLEQRFNVSIWNFINSDWYLIENNTCYNDFSSLNLSIASNFYNSSYHILLKFEAVNASNEFQLNLEMLRFDYNWTKTSGNIHSSFYKDVYFNFLDRYENYTQYKNYLNISLNFRYRFSNFTNYNHSINFTIESNEHNLTVGSWKDFDYLFTFNSILRNNFTICFNLTNGLLEISEMNYSITFNCLDLQNRTVLYQYFSIEPLFSLDHYEKTECEIYLSFEYDFIDAQEGFDYFNSIDNTLFLFIINVSSEDSTITLEYSYNISRTETFSLNLRDVIENNSKNEFRDISLEIYLSGDEASLELDNFLVKRKYEQIQVDKSPRTDSKSVDFIDYLTASRSFSYWYFQNSLEINSVDLTNIRTSETIETFEINNSRYYFQESIQENDILISNIDYNPNFNFSYEIVENNGVYSKIKVKYRADLVVRNVTLVLDLNECYNDNWTLNAEQNSNTLKLEIPSLDFSTIEKSFYIEGYSDTPSARISSYESDQNWNQIAEDSEITFAAFLEYPKYTNTFLLNVESDWTCYDVHYGNKTYSTKRLSSSSIYVVGTGFDKLVNNSYLHFTAKPFRTADWNYENDTITITIESSLPVEKAFFKYAFNPSGVHDLEIIESNIEINDLSDSEIPDYLTFNCDLIPKGKTIIRIHVNFATPLEVFIQMLFPLLTVAGFIGAYYYFKNNEAAAEKIQKFVNEKIIDKVEKKLGKGGYEELRLYTDETNKVHFKKIEENQKKEVKN